MILNVLRSPYLAVYLWIALIFFQAIYYLLRSRKKDGKLVIDTSDPNKDLYQIKLDTPLDDLPKKHTILLKVEIAKNLNDISQ